MLGDVVLIDLDQRTMQNPHNDTSDLPSDVISLLRHELRSSSDLFLSDGLARSFLRFHEVINSTVDCIIIILYERWDKKQK